MLVALGQLGERMRGVAQALERRDRRDELDQKSVGSLQVRVRERDARIERMQVAALAALELAKLLTERCERAMKAVGASPRSGLMLLMGAKSLARFSGRDFVTPDDVKRMAHPVLAHRLILRPESRLRKKTPAAVVTELVTDARVPVLERNVEPGGNVFSER